MYLHSIVPLCYLTFFLEIFLPCYGIAIPYSVKDLDDVENCSESAMVLLRKRRNQLIHTKCLPPVLPCGEISFHYRHQFWNNSSLLHIFPVTNGGFLVNRFVRLVDDNTVYIFGNFGRDIVIQIIFEDAFRIPIRWIAPATARACH